MCMVYECVYIIITFHAETAEPISIKFGRCGRVDDTGDTYLAKKIEIVQRILQF